MDKGRRHNNNSNNHNNNRRRDHKQKSDGPKREAILDLGKYQDKQIRVKFIGGRQVVGTLKGYDQLMNLVLDGTIETLRDPEDDTVLTNKTRTLGEVIIRGPLLLSISPIDGSEIIDNPFVNAEEEPVV